MQWNTTQQKERTKEFLPFGTAWMERESTMLSEISHAVKNKYNMISHLQEEHNEQNKHVSKINQRHGNKEQTDSNQRGGGRG